jgi:phenol hydroxylase P5 protein
VSTTLSLPIRDVRVETPRTRVVHLALGATVFEFCAGQSVRMGAAGSALRKPYSIACSPDHARRDASIELLIQVDEAGNAGSHLGEPAAGRLVEVEGPLGHFCFPSRPAERDLLLVAGGTGIAPLRAMVWHALETCADARIALFYSARSAAEFAYAAELRGLARQRRIVLRETVTREPGEPWAGERGRITRERLASMLASPATLCLACGPPAFVMSITGWLRLLGVSEERILSEGW